jgi:hypothetical protein
MKRVGMRKAFCYQFVWGCLLLVLVQGIFSYLNAEARHVGFIKRHEERFFVCTRRVDVLLMKYRSYYKVDEQNRQIILKKSLKPREKKQLLHASKELDEVIECFSSCSPGDYDYMEVKEKYLPVLREMSHRFHTFVLQPLNISRLDRYDHVRKILVPSVIVAGAIGVLLLLKKIGLLPRFLCFSTKKLLIAGAIVAFFLILRNYRNQFTTMYDPAIFKQGSENKHITTSAHSGTDFGALAHQLQRSEAHCSSDHANKSEHKDDEKTSKTAELLAITNQMIAAIKNVKQEFAASS